MNKNLSKKSILLSTGIGHIDRANPLFFDTPKYTQNPYLSRMVFLHYVNFPPVTTVVHSTWSETDKINDLWGDWGGGSYF